MFVRSNESSIEICHPSAGSPPIDPTQRAGSRKSRIRRFSARVPPIGTGLRAACGPFERVQYRDLPSVGRFSADRFDPTRWKPEVPNPAFLRARADDLFWGARRVMAFTDEMISAAVGSASYSDERAARHITETLISRRDLVGRAWLTTVNPIVDPSFDGKVLLFRNAAVDAGVAAAPTEYVVSWTWFDIATGATTDLGMTKASDLRVTAPAGLQTGAGSYVRVEISAKGGPESWAKPIHAYFRQQPEGWKLVGFERMPGSNAL